MLVQRHQRIPILHARVFRLLPAGIRQGIVRRVRESEDVADILLMVFLQRPTGAEGDGGVPAAAPFGGSLDDPLGAHVDHMLVDDGVVTMPPTQKRRCARPAPVCTGA